MALRGHRIAFLAAVFAATPLFAQQDPRVTQLEQRLDELTRQVQQIRHELDQLKGQQQPVAPAAAAAPAAAPTADAEDLTKIEVSPSPAPAQSAAAQPQAAETPAAAPALTDVQPVANASNPGASKALNPDISVIGDFFGKAGTVNPYEYGPGDAMRSPLSFDEAEVAYQAYVDPYAKANFFLSASQEGLSVEEAYAQFVTLPWDITARAGKFKALFGKANTWHTHVRPWVDQPLVIHNFFTDEQLSDSGVEISKILPNRFAYVEATAEVFGGNNSVFHRGKQSDLFYNGHLKLFKDLSEDSNVELGGSFASGTLPETSLRAGDRSNFAGVDLTYRWKPLIRSTYRSLVARFEGIVNDRPDVEHSLRGFYTSLDYQFAQRWYAGVRLDQADRSGSVVEAGAVNPLSPFRDRGASATLTFWPSEFSQLRGQLRRTSYGGARSVNEILFQLQFAIGAHGAHTF